MAARRVVSKVRPLVSIDAEDCRRRVMAHYIAWYRYLPIMLEENSIPYSIRTARNRLKLHFRANADMKDIRAIDAVIIKGELELLDCQRKFLDRTLMIEKYFVDHKKESKATGFIDKFIQGQE